MRFKWLEPTFWILAILACLLWSFWPVLKSAVAAFSLDPVSRSSVNSESQGVHLELQRSIQKHFLNYHVYVPLEDVVFVDQFVRSNPELEPILKKVCGNAPIVIWIPLQFRLPVFGERSAEWCWKPSLKN
jgi:hypothetical protein